MIGVRCLECGGDTLWRYPHLQWAMSHVPDYPPRCFMQIPVWDKKRQPMPMTGMSQCSDPFGHLKLIQENQS